MTEEDIIAYIDGELDGAARARAEAALAADAALRARAEQHRALRQAMLTSFDSVLTEPVPERLIGAVRQPPATVVSIDSGRRRVAAIPAAGWLTALAATLVVGVFTGRQLAPAGGALGADPVLISSLDGTGIAPIKTAPIKIALSYRDRSGRYCRVYEDRRRIAAAGIACRADAGWAVEVVAAVPAATPGTYHTAAAALPPPVLTTIDTTIAGAPLDRASERAAAAAHWNARR